MSTNIVELTLENFQNVVLEQSKEKLILVDFWAEQVPESVELRDKLASKLAPFESDFIFATVDCQSQQQIAMQFGVKSLPTVVLFKDGQPVDGFAGGQPESEIRELLSKHLPKPQDALFEQGTAKAREQNWSEAYPLLKQAYELEPERHEFRLMLANAAIELGKISQAEAIIDSIGLVDQDAGYQQVLAKLELAKQAAESPEIQALQQLLEQEPDSFEMRQKLAIALNQANRNEEALELLFSILKKDLAFGETKKTFLDIIANLPDGDGLASSYRRKLYTLLY